MIWYSFFFSPLVDYICVSNDVVVSATVAIATAPVQKPKVKTKTAAHYYVLESSQRHEPPKKGERRNKRRRERTDIIRAPPAFVLLKRKNWKIKKNEINVPLFPPLSSRKPREHALRIALNHQRQQRKTHQHVKKKRKKMANWQPKFEIEFQVRKIPYRWLILDLEWNQARQRYMAIYNPDTQSSANHTRKKNLSLYMLAVCTVVMPRNAPRMHKQTPTWTTKNRIAVTQSIVRVLYSPLIIIYGSLFCVFLFLNLFFVCQNGRKLY